MNLYYLTYNDVPTGVYYSQVVENARFVSRISGHRAKLISVFPARRFLDNRRKIRLRYQPVVAIPSISRLRNFEKQAMLLNPLVKRDECSVVIARGAFAANLALDMKATGRIGKVCYDGRGAVASEFKEFGLSEDIRLNENIHHIERRAVLKSDFRISVSTKLVDYWCRAFKYAGKDHVVLPCMLGEAGAQSAGIMSGADREEKRNKLGFDNDDIILVYSGSTAGWQSLDYLSAWITRLLDSDPRIRILFLSRRDDSLDRLLQRHPRRIKQDFVAHEQVPDYLQAADYGLVIREASITNRVAAPTKFAEYLAAGLRVLISENIGDYSGFVATHKCGICLSDNTLPKLEKPGIRQRELSQDIAKEYFHRTSPVNAGKYDKLLSHLGLIRNIS